MPLAALTFAASVSRTSTKNPQRASYRRSEAAAAAVAIGWHVACSIAVGGGAQVTTANNEIDSDDDGQGGAGKGAARRRVDAYHEALRERAAMRELEQPFVLDDRTWPPPRY
jgi:hypothetical protein